PGRQRTRPSLTPRIQEGLIGHCFRPLARRGRVARTPLEPVFESETVRGLKLCTDIALDARDEHVLHGEPRGAHTGDGAEQGVSHAASSGIDTHAASTPLAENVYAPVWPPIDVPVMVCVVPFGSWNHSQRRSAWGLSVTNARRPPPRRSTFTVRFMPLSPPPPGQRLPSRPRPADRR